MASLALAEPHQRQLMRGAARLCRLHFVLLLERANRFPGISRTHNIAALSLRRALMPPWIYLRGLAIFAFTMKPPSFILGHSYPHGVWFFFPILFLLKSPLAFLLLLVLALVVGVVA